MFPPPQTLRGWGQGTPVGGWGWGGALKPCLKGQVPFRMRRALGPSTSGPDPASGSPRTPDPGSGLGLIMKLIVDETLRGTFLFDEIW